MKLNEICNVILEELKSSYSSIGCEEKNIRLGKFGEMPTVAPFIWLYAEPKEVLTKAGVFDMGKGKISIFCGAKSKSADEARLESIKILERSIRCVLYTTTTQTNIIELSFDSMYSDIAVTFAEFEVQYQLESLL